MPPIANPDRRNSLVRMAGLIILLFVVNSAAGLFSLRLASQRHAEDLDTLNLLMETLDNTRQAQVHFKNQVQEWKNVLLRGADPDDLEHYTAALRREASGVRARLDAAREGMEELNLSEAELVAPLLAEHELILETYEEQLKRWKPDLPSQVWIMDRELRGIDRGLNETMDDLVNDLLAAGAALRMEMARESTAQDAATRRFLIIGAGATTILLLFMLGMAVRRG